MPAVELIAAAYDVQSRGLERLQLMCLSLSLGTVTPDRMTFVCTGSTEEYEAIGNLLSGFDFVRVLHLQQEQFNKSEAVNWGAKQSLWEYLCFTDVDYLFSPDLLEAAMRLAKPSRLILKRVMNLPKGAATAENTQSWNYPSKTPFGFGDFACGGFMLHHRSAFEKLGGFDERFNVGAMDWHYMYRFKNAYKDVRWITRGEILHQWHPKTKDRWKEDARRNEVIAMKELGLSK